MTAGTGVPTMRTWLITALQDVTGTGEALDGVRVQYSPPTNLDQVLADNGNVEVIYWAETRATVNLRGMKGTANVKYREEATFTLVVLVAADTVDQTLEDVEARAADLLGQVVLVFQGTAMPALGVHNIACWIEGWETNPGRLSIGGVPVHAMAYDVDVHSEVNVEL